MTRGSQWQGVGIRHRGERQVLRTAQWNEVLRGESSPSRRPGIRRPRCTTWRDDGSRANLALRSDRARPLASVPDNRARYASAVWRCPPICGKQYSSEASRTSIWWVSPRLRADAAIGACRSDARGLRPRSMRGGRDAGRRRRRRDRRRQGASRQRRPALRQRRSARRDSGDRRAARLSDDPRRARNLESRFRRGGRRLPADARETWAGRSAGRSARLRKVVTPGRDMPGVGRRAAVDPVARTRRSKDTRAPSAKSAARPLRSSRSTRRPVMRRMRRSRYQSALRSATSASSTSPASKADRRTRL